MGRPYQALLAIGVCALMLAGCNDSSDNEYSGSTGTEQPAKPDLEVVAAPSSEQAPDFIVRPYLQAPDTDTMTVMFETGDQEPQVWVRPFGSGEAFTEVMADVASDDGLVFRARLTGLVSNTLYEYYVLTAGEDGARRVTQAFAFKTWPNPGDGVTDATFIALSDTQLDREIYEPVLRNIVNQGLMVEECQRDQPVTCAEKIKGITISGDVVNIGGTRDQWREELFGRMSEITPYVPLITVPGNHDYGGNAELELYKTYMEPPRNGSANFEEHWYYLDFLDMRLIGLDSYPISGSHGNYNQQTLIIQRQWLRDVLANAAMESKQFVVGMFHHGCLSEMWTAGESIGSCELVSDLEQYSQDTGAVSGHFFGHTHAYSRGQSIDVPHLWLNAATASGYIEPLNDWGHQLTQVRDYDTFEVSRSEFGYNVVTVAFGQDRRLTLERKKGGADNDTGFDVVDRVVFQPRINDSFPIATAGDGDDQLTRVNLGIQVADPEQVRAVHWQVSESEDFSGTIYDIWGNETRVQNVHYDDAAEVEGDEYQGYQAIDTQDGADIFALDLSGLLACRSIRPGADAYYRWHKPSVEQNTHDSENDPYSGKLWPKLVIWPAKTYYWRARVRDEAMNWSIWSPVYRFSTSLFYPPRICS